MTLIFDSLYSSSSSFLFLVYQIDGSVDEGAGESGDGTQDSVLPVKVNNIFSSLLSTMI